MARLGRNRILTFAILALAGGLAWFVFLSREAPVNRPLVFFWAWERPEDLRFLEGRDAGVAFLAGTVTLRGDRAEIKPRLQPLLVAPDTSLVSVIRIESDHASMPTLSEIQVQQTVQSALDLGGRPQISMIQLDFDAVVSERGFYRRVIESLHDRMPQEKLLSMTALASWCMGDPWIRGIRVDEIVPMLFQMGPDARSVRRRLERGGDFKLSVCRGAVGLSTDESWPRMTPRRRYVFSPTAWTQEQAEQILREVE